MGGFIADGSLIRRLRGIEELLRKQGDIEQSETIDETIAVIQQGVLRPSPHEWIEQCLGPSC